MRFVLAHLTTQQAPWSQSALDYYVDKIKAFTKFEVHEIPVKKFSREAADIKKRLESKEILNFLKPEDLLVLFDEHGKPLNSLEFAKTIEKIQNTGKQRVIFLIGGAFGVDDSVKKRAQYTISFSNMVFNHWVAQVVAVEQIYRGFCINKNLPYHNS